MIKAKLDLEGSCVTCPNCGQWLVVYPLSRISKYELKKKYNRNKFSKVKQK